MSQEPNKSRSLSRDPEAIAFARQQRSTANEFAQAIWQVLRNRGCRSQKFRREYPVPPYTIDFCCVALMLIIEVDGEHHLSADGKQHDESRDRFLRERGYRVLRIAGYDVIRNLSGVIELIQKAIDARVEELGNATQ